MKKYKRTWFFWVLAYCIAWIPVRIQSILGRFLVLLGWPFLKKDRQRLSINVRKVYRLPHHSSFSQTFTKQVFRHQILALFDTLTEIINPNRSIEFRGFKTFQDQVIRLLSHDRGLIVITGHMGSWELVAHVTAKASGQNFYALAKPSKLPAFTLFLDQLRERMATKVLWTDRKSLLKDMIQHLKDKKCLGFVMDQKPEGRVGPSVQFMGFPTEFVAGPAKLASRLKTPVLAVFCMREGPLTYRICHEQISSGEEILSEVELTQKMAHAIEKTIRIYPEQWVWNYKRWRFTTQ